MVWYTTAKSKICKTCKTAFAPTTNIMYECFSCVPKNLRKFNARLRCNYGLGYVDYMKMLRFQKHSCKICGITIIPRTTGNKKDSAVIDHCHTTGKVRGILCRRCNIGLGHFDDDCSKLEAAIDYLLKEKERTPDPEGKY